MTEVRHPEAISVAKGFQSKKTFLLNTNKSFIINPLPGYEFLISNFVKVLIIV